MSSKKFFIYKIFLHILKCLKLHQLNIIKIIHERYQSFPNVGNTKKQIMFVNDTKIYQKMKNESLLGIEKVL